VRILGHTPDDDLIIQVSHSEWELLKNGERPPISGWYDTEISEFLKRQKLPGISWRMIVSSLIKDGKIDGSIESFKSFLENNHKIPHSSKKGREKLLSILGSSYT